MGVMEIDTIQESPDRPFACSPSEWATQNYTKHHHHFPDWISKKIMTYIEMLADANPPTHSTLFVLVFDANPPMQYLLFDVNPSYFQHTHQTFIRISHSDNWIAIGTREQYYYFSRLEGWHHSLTLTVPAYTTFLSAIGDLGMSILLFLNFGSCLLKAFCTSRATRRFWSTDIVNRKYN